MRDRFKKKALQSLKIDWRAAPSLLNPFYGFRSTPSSRKGAAFFQAGLLTLPPF